MSHSSLSAQLASLHSKSGVSSRQHSDAVGRGIHHSSKAGHTILNNSVKNKPSVLYPDSKSAAAADVPFTTLRENAVASLQFLSQHCSPLFDINGDNLPWRTLFGPKSVKYERGLNSKETNNKFDGLVKDALYMLSSAWGDSIYAINLSSSTFIQLGANKPSSVLHTLEYLVQKYYVHVHNAEELLVAFLPHHENFLFDRILQLIDIAQYPHWSFLRPFSAAKGMQGVPRTTIAKWAASTKDNGGGIAIVKKITEVAKRAAKVHCQEKKLGILNHNEARRGISISISFAASTLAETLHIQHAANGTIDEQILRILAPVIFNAIEPSSSGDKWSLGALCPEWRSFGRILISLLVEKCELNNDLNNALANAVVKGCQESIQLCIHDEMKANGEEFIKSRKLKEFNLDEVSDEMQQSILEISADAILTIMTIVQNLPETSIEKETPKSLLPIRSSKNHGKNHMIGYNISMIVYRAITQIPFLVASMGYLYTEKDVDVRPLLASIIVMSVSNTRCKAKDFERSVEALFQLCTEELLQNAWNDDETHLIESTSSLIVECGAKVTALKADMKDTVQRSLANILKAMKNINTYKCDVGITHAVTLTSSIPEKKQEGEMIRELLLISGHLNKEITDGKRSKDECEKKDIDRSDHDDLDHLLPPMMALEHPNTSLRMQAIFNISQGTGDDSSVDDIAPALLRRYALDDDAKVATKALETLQLLYMKGTVPSSFFLQDDVSKEILFGLNKWSQTSKQISKIDEDIVECLCTSVKVAALCSRLILNNDKDGETKVDEGPLTDIIDLIVTISRYILPDNWGKFNDKITKTGLISLLTAIGEESDKFESRNDCLQNICDNNIFQAVVKYCIENDSNYDKSNDFLGLFLNIWKEISNDSEISSNTKLVVSNAAIATLSTLNQDNEDNVSFFNQLKLINEVLEKCLSDENMTSSIQLVIKLCSLRSNQIFDEVSTPMIKKLFEIYRKSNSVNSSVLLVEAMTRPSTKTLGTKRLIILVTELVIKRRNIDAESCILVLLASLSLCSHPEIVIRQMSLDLFSDSCTSLARKDSKFKAIKISCLSDSPLKTNVLMDGANALPQILRHLVKTCQSTTSASDFLLNSCDVMVGKGMNILTDESTNNCADGFCHAASVLLSAMEIAGETCFPLSKRWEIVGKQLFHFCMEKWPHDKSLTISTRSLLEAVVVMTKGVTVVTDNIDEGVVVSSHKVGSGRRSRSYSVGTSEGISYVQQYPDDMTKSILKFLEICSQHEMNDYFTEFFGAMTSTVLTRSSWVNGVFKKATKSTRRDISTLLLSLRSNKNFESAGSVLFGLHLDAAEILHLLTSNDSVGSNNDSIGLLALTVLTECILQQPENLGSGEDLIRLYLALFERLSFLSSRKSSEFEDGCDYTRCCIIQCLLPLTKRLKLKKKDDLHIGKNATLLVTLLGREGDKNEIKKLLSNKSKTLALQLLTDLCALSPKTIVGSLIPAMINSIDIDDTLENSNASENAIMAIIPTYCKHASSTDLTLIDLLNAFIQHCESDEGTSWTKKLLLYTYLSKGLLACSTSGGIVMATVITTFLASESSYYCMTRKEDSDDQNKMVGSPTHFAADLLQQIQVQDQINCSLYILRYISSVLPILGDETAEVQDNEMREEFFLISASDVFALISQETGNENNMQYLLWFVVAMINMLQQNIFSLPVVKRSIRHSDDGQAAICLKIWQELSSLQSSVSYYKLQDERVSQRFGGKKVFQSMEENIGNILAVVQRMLPTPHFLASVGSLLSDAGTSTDLRKGAIQLLAERSSEVDPSSHEATLFLEMVPDLVNTAKSKLSTAENRNNDYDLSILRQSSFRGIEELAKNLGLGAADDKLRQKRSNAFLPAFQTVATFLHRESSSIDLKTISDQMSQESQTAFSMEAQVLGSATLCAASLISLLKVKCLSQLQTLVKPVISILSAVNSSLGSNNNIMIGSTLYQSLKMIQLSTLRTLVAVAESLPQFLVPYVETLLSPTCLPLISVVEDTRDEGIAVNTMTERLENAIAMRSPVHQLIPTLSKSMKKCFNGKSSDANWKEAMSILRILNTCISNSSRSLLTPLAGKVLNTLVQAYNYDHLDGRRQLLKQANTALLSMVMKLSESQLRPLYARLREWRGNIDDSSGDHNVACKRYAFWSLSAAISQKLRNIFLPCMSSVVGDIVKELEYAVTILCSSSMKSMGNKRLKTNLTLAAIDVDALSPLQPLLLCLETALKADAHEGGNWIRSEDGQRYRMILEPLGKLLHASIPKDLSIVFDLSDEVAKSISSYEMLIEGVGTEEEGNLSQTLTALAAAAGNEQLWKPLNYAILDACGNEKRSEVRKAGVKSLLNIIQTLGEEYMVLLPECLPVLSELLEDEDETIIALAKECVRQGEELLGESLEDSLR